MAKLKIGKRGREGTGGRASIRTLSVPSVCEIEL